MQLPITKPDNHLGLRILAYYLIFFPSLDVMSAYPLVVHVLVNNIYIIITGKDIWTFMGFIKRVLMGVVMHHALTV